VLATAAYVLLATSSAQAATEPLVSTWTYVALLLVAAALCGARGIVVAFERLPWLAFAAAATLWAAGQVVWQLVYEPRAVAPYPSAADALWLAAYPAACVGTIALMHTRLRASFRAGLWVDAAVGATAVGAVVAALLLTPVVEGAGADPAALATHLAYPPADLVLLALVMTALSLTGWRPGAAWAAVALALALQSFTDAVYAREVALGS
jgi:hypothetical protein